MTACDQRAESRDFILCETVNVAHRSRVPTRTHTGEVSEEFSVRK